MSPAPGDRAVRAARSGAATAAAVLVALAAHLAGGGTPPAPELVVAVPALAWPVGLLLVGSGARLWRQGAVVAVAQAMLHVVFALGGASGAGHGASGMAGMHAFTPVAGAAPTSHASGMWWAHAGAWALTVAAWRWGGAVLRRLLVRVAVRRLLLSLPPIDVEVARPRRADAAVLPVGAPLAAHRDRGPPASA